MKKLQVQSPAGHGDPVPGVLCHRGASFFGGPTDFEASAQ